MERQGARRKNENMILTGIIVYREPTVVAGHRRCITGVILSVENGVR